MKAAPPWKPTGLMRAIARTLAEAPGQLTERDLREAFPSQKPVLVRSALRELRASGFVRFSPRRSQPRRCAPGLITVLKPYPGEVSA